MHSVTVQMWVHERICSENLNIKCIPSNEFDADSYIRSIEINDFFPFHDATKEKKEMGKSLLKLKSKQRDKISQMLWKSSESLLFHNNGIYFHLDSKGRIEYSKKLSTIKVVSSKTFGELFITERLKAEKNYMHFIWTNKNRKMRIKQPFDESENGKLKRKKKKNRNKTKKRASRIRSDLSNELKDDIGPFTVQDKKAKNDASYCDKSAENEYDDDSDNNMQDIDDDNESDNGCHNDNEPKKCNFKKIKKLSRKLSYLFSDAYIIPKHSKRQTQQMKLLLLDTYCCPLTKSNMKSHANQITHHETKGHGSLHNLTLGNFFASKDLDSLGLDGTFDAIKCDSVVELTANDDKIANRVKEKKSEDNVQYDAAIGIQVVCMDGEDIGDKMETNDNDHQENDNNNSQDSNAIVVLSRSLLRPDNMTSEFKDNYKESFCKNRRFVLDISHFAHQYLIGLKSLPSNIISQSEIIMYMVFAYVKEANIGKDKYRVWVNSTLPLLKPRIMFHELILKQLTSIHELIQKAMCALDDPRVNQILMTRKNGPKKYLAQLPSCTFNLLWSTRLKLRLMEPSAKVESINNRVFQANHHRLSSIGVKQGPSQPSICGICLQSFDEKNIVPIALAVCSHWFCEECWKLKLCAQIKKKEQEHIMCIERDCKAAVDDTTLVSILDAKLIRKYHNDKTKKVVQGPLNMISCPNVSCKKTISSLSTDIGAYKSDPFLPIMCSCSWQSCPKCFETPHWPVSCDTSKTYVKTLDAQGLDTFSRYAKDEELPDLVLRGKSCPQCGIFIQEKNEQKKIEQCACGCFFCWPCGKKVDEGKIEDHFICQERFELSNRRLKAKVVKLNADDVTNSKISRWLKVALNHRQMRHPQVVRILYDMADQIAAKVSQISKSGLYTGDAKHAAIGWKSALRKWNQRMCERLEKSVSEIKHKDNAEDKNQCLSIDRGEPEASKKSEDQRADCDNDGSDTNLTNKSNLSLDLSDSNPNTDLTDLQRPLSSSSSTSSSLSLPTNKVANKNIIDPLIAKAVSNIIQIKLEIHHIIEHLAVMLEFDHSLNQSGKSGKIIRCLERAEDLCEGLGILLQPPHNENATRIIPTFLRLRLQTTHMLSTLHHHQRLA